MTTSPSSQNPSPGKAQIIEPPNSIRDKVKPNGLDLKALDQAESALQNNSVDFKPQAQAFLDQILQSLNVYKRGDVSDKKLIEDLSYPAMQLKAQGKMFHYDFITKISDILVNFLDTMTEVNPQVIDIVAAHHRTLQLALKMNIPEKSGLELEAALKDACLRFYHNRAHPST